MLYKATRRELDFCMEIGLQYFWNFTFNFRRYVSKKKYCKKIWHKASRTGLFFLMKLKFAGNTAEILENNMLEQKHRTNETNKYYMYIYTIYNIHYIYSLIKDYFALNHDSLLSCLISFICKAPIAKIYCSFAHKRH